jgi:NAD(P)-dependent dehydrogenase (short-subunit alcohol dehydrogenase family)
VTARASSSRHEQKLDPTLGVRGRTALVTGGSRGIGRACAEALLVHGANVAVTYQRGQALAEELVQAWPERASAHFLDLRSRRSIEQCTDEVEGRWGTIQILVNNAAAGSATIAHYEPDPRQVDSALIDINAKGMLWVCIAVIPRMKADSGSTPCKVINLSSVGGLQTFPSMRLADNMSKAAVVSMSRQLAAEHAHTGVDVFTVCPGATDTDMLRQSTLDRLQGDERRAFIERLPKGRLIAPEEVAVVILFLASGYSTLLHGATLDCSMGLGVHPGLITGR